MYKSVKNVMRVWENALYIEKVCKSMLIVEKVDKIRKGYEKCWENIRKYTVQVLRKCAKYWERVRKCLNCWESTQSGKYEKV